MDLPVQEYGRRGPGSANALMGDSMSGLSRAIFGAAAAATLATAPAPDLPPSYVSPVTDPNSATTQMVEAPQTESMYLQTVEFANDVRDGLGGLADATRIGDESTGEDPVAESEQVIAGPPDPDTGEPDEWSLAADDFAEAESTEADITDTADSADFTDAAGTDASEGGL